MRRGVSSAQHTRHGARGCRPAPRPAPRTVRYQPHEPYSHAALHPLRLQAFVVNEFLTLPPRSKAQCSPELLIYCALAGPRRRRRARRLGSPTVGRRARRHASATLEPMLTRIQCAQVEFKLRATQRPALPHVWDGPVATFGLRVLSCQAAQAAWVPPACAVPWSH